jgi:DNA-binding NtrC family response regulator
VLSAGTIKQALEAIGVSKCDVILSDIALSHGTGWDLLSKANLPASIYALAMSGFGTGRGCHPQ